MKIAAISSGRSNNNNNNHSKVNSTAEGANSSPVCGNFSSSLNKDESESTSSVCSECTRTDSDSSDASGEKKNRTKEALASKGTKDTRASSSSASGSDSSDDDNLDDFSDSDEGSDRSEKVQLPKAFTKANNKIRPPPRADTSELEGDDGASSSDMELPDLVTAAIQRVESGSDGENTKTALATTQYTSTLLHDFMVKTQMLGTTLTEIDRMSSTTNSLTPNPDNAKSDHAAKSASKSSAAPTAVVRKRGRPRKNPPVIDIEATKTSESPDSGIISTPHSPVQSDRKTAAVPTGKSKSTKPPLNISREVGGLLKPKLNISSLEKSIYATERVLYPPRRKRTDTQPYAKPDELLDPVWRKIDVNKKFRRPSVSGYKSDGSTVCSKVLAAQSDYLSDYGSFNQRVLTGYKSDYSCKSRRSGYKSDFSVKARSCGYRSDCSLKHRRKIRRKRRTKTASTKPSVNDQDILMLAGLSLGQSEESSRDSVHKTDSLPPTQVDNLARKRPMFRRKTFSGVLALSRTPSASGRESLATLCDRVTKRISGLDTTNNSKPSLGNAGNLASFAGLNSKDATASLLKLSGGKPGQIRQRRSSAVSHCSSRCSTSSRHPFRKRRRKRLKSCSRSESNPEVNITKLNLQIDQIINSFTTLCAINGDKPSKDKDAGKANATKRGVKKRKGSENVESTASTATTTKRRHKKTVQTQSPDEHKLPLKKRHYPLAPGEKSESKSNQAHASAAVTEKEKQKAEEISAKSIPKISATKAVTPKKRHLLETPSVPNSSRYNSASTDTHASNDSNHVKENHSASSAADGSNGKISNQNKKNDTLTRKKNRLEGLVSKIQPPSGTPESPPSAEIPPKGASSRVSVIRSNLNESGPPPGIFEPTVDLELQIPYTSISIPSIITKSEVDSPRQSDNSFKGLVVETNQQNEKMVEKLLNKTGAHLWLKRKRKKPNRTGFPTLKKKKKKVGPTMSEKSASPILETTLSAGTTLSAETLAALKMISSPEIRIRDILQGSNCDRVPSEGETAATFIERNSRPRLSVISLEKLQGKIDTEKAGTVEGNKRSRETSLEKTQSRKKSRSDILRENANVARDPSSDNEPLINFVQKKRARGKIDSRANLSDEDEPLMNRIASKKAHLSDEKKSDGGRKGRVTKTIRRGSSPKRGSKVAVAVVKLEILEKANLLAINQQNSVDNANQPNAVVNHSQEVAAENLGDRDTSPVLKRKRGRPFKNQRLETSKAAEPDTAMEVVAFATEARTEEISPTRESLRNKKLTENVLDSVIDCDGGKSKNGTINKAATKGQLEVSSKIDKTKVKTTPSGEIGIADKMDKTESSVNKTKPPHRLPIYHPKRFAIEGSKIEADPPEIVENTKDKIDRKTKQPQVTSEKYGKRRMKDKVEATEKADKEETRKDELNGPLGSSSNKKSTKSEKNRSQDKTASNEKEKAVIPENSKKTEHIQKSHVSKSPEKVEKPDISKRGSKLEKDAAKKTEKVDKSEVPSKQIAELSKKAEKSEISVTSKSLDKTDKATKHSDKPDKSDKLEKPEVVKKVEKNADKMDGSKKLDKSNESSPSTKHQSNNKLDKKSNLSNKESEASQSTVHKSSSKKDDKKSGTPANIKKMAEVIQPNEETEEPYDEADIKPLDENDYPEHDPLPSIDDDCQIDLNAEKSVSSDGKKSVPKLRKKYLTAGLFSNHYKEIHTLADKSSKVSSAKTDDPPVCLLPPPLYCEKYFRQTQHDFQLPYDLWWAHENEKLPGRNIVQSWNFKKIRTNVYCDVRANPSSDHQPCSCKSDSGCGDECLNRMVYTECSPETCPCRDKCQNTKIQRHIIAPGVERFMTKNKGWGVQTKQPVKKGTYILEYVGEVVTEREFKDRMATLYIQDIHHYCLHLDGGLVIDGHRMGSDCRFVNHSCSPNCEMQKWSVNGLSRMALFAMRDIPPGDELTYDYNFSLFNPAEGQPCKCETAECRGVIGGKSQRVRPIEPKAVSNKHKSNKKVRSGRPKKDGASKSRTFMHSKDASKMNVFQLPGPKEQGLIIDGHCFLLRNLKKVMFHLHSL